MPTYAETQNEPPFDWHDFLRRVKTGEAKLNENEVAEYLAAGWVTCACGSQCSRIPRYGDGQPVDDELSNAGASFYWCIKSSQWEEAEETLLWIEARSANILAEMGATE